MCFHDKEVVGLYRGRCRECQRQAIKRYDVKHKLEKAAYSSLRHKTNPTIGREANWKRNGLVFSEGDYVEVYIRQDGRCRICRKSVLRLCVDHNHRTKAVRGLLCRQCNAGLGSFGDNWVMLERAANYLRSFYA